MAPCRFERVERLLRTRAVCGARWPSFNHCSRRLKPTSRVYVSSDSFYTNLLAAAKNILEQPPARPSCCPRPLLPPPWPRLSPFCNPPAGRPSPTPHPRICRSKSSTMTSTNPDQTARFPHILAHLQELSHYVWNYEIEPFHSVCFPR